VAQQSLDDNHHYIVISSDNHAGADLYGYKPYLEKKWHDEFDEWAAAYSNPWDFVEARAAKDGFELESEELLTGAASWHSALNWDSAKRLEHMAADGVVAEVIFPNTAPPFMPGSVLSSTAGPACKRTTGGWPTSAAKRPASARASPRCCSKTSMTPSRRSGGSRSWG
jgi:hypothetical protein